jgi:hypothetical protein
MMSSVDAGATSSLEAGATPKLGVWVQSRAGAGGPPRVGDWIKGTLIRGRDLTPKGGAAAQGIEQLPQAAIVSGVLPCETPAWIHSPISRGVLRLAQNSMLKPQSPVSDVAENAHPTACYYRHLSFPRRGIPPRVLTVPCSPRLHAKWSMAGGRKSAMRICFWSLRVRKLHPWRPYAKRHSPEGGHRRLFMVRCPRFAPTAGGQVLDSKSMRGSMMV